MVTHYVFGLAGDTDAIATRNGVPIWLGRTSGAGVAQFESYGSGGFEVSTLFPDPPPRDKPKHPVSHGARSLLFDPRDGSLLLSLAARAEVSVRVYDATGRIVATPHEGELDAGEHRIAWGCRSDDGSAIRATGVYFVRVIVDGASATGKVLVLR